MLILGLSCFYHDAAAALVNDGTLIAAAQEERFSRIKHDPEFPRQAIEDCLRTASKQMSEIDAVVFYDKPLLKFDRILIGYMAQPFRSYRAFLKAMPLWLRRKLWTEHLIRKELEFDGDLLFLPHHLSHAAGCFYCSPFDEAAILTVDGVGEWATASYGTGKGTAIDLHREMHYPHSVGLLYSAFTYYLGFQVNSSEYKIMGLAPYGHPRYADLIKAHLVRIHEDGSIHLNLRYFTFQYGLNMTGRRFARLFGQPRRQPESTLDDFHADVAASIQSVTEEIVLRMAAHVKQQTNQRNLCFSGGVALNCAANGRLLRESGFDDVYIQPASGDAGGAVGAALYGYHALTEQSRKPQSFFGLGPQYSDVTIERALRLYQAPFVQLEPEALAETVAESLAQGKIVALFQGPMEFGPRALGFRSILADPRSAEMKTRINAAVKYREPFRPFAPAVRLANAPEWFECDRPAPYMLFNFVVREDKRHLIPAVTHEDHSARIQTVAPEDNPVLHDILSSFQNRTGVPVLLNTSFNLRGHPIVNTPEQALATVCSSGIDQLAIGSYLIDRTSLPANLIKQLRIGQRPD